MADRLEEEIDVFLNDVSRKCERMRLPSKPNAKAFESDIRNWEQCKPAQICGVDVKDRVDARRQWEIYDRALRAGMSDDEACERAGFSKDLRR